MVERNAFPLRALAGVVLGNMTTKSASPSFYRLNLGLAVAATAVD